nr:hypothetical protein Iba_chr13aCG11250 [Ipomoea batatas]
MRTLIEHAPSIDDKESVQALGKGAGARGGLPNAEGGVEATEGQWPEQLSRPASREEADGERSIGHRAGQQASSRAPSQALLAFQFRISNFRIPVTHCVIVPWAIAIALKEQSSKALTPNLREPLLCHLNTVLEAFGRVKTVRNNYVEVLVAAPQMSPAAMENDCVSEQGWCLRFFFPASLYQGWSLRAQGWSMPPELSSRFAPPSNKLSATPRSEKKRDQAACTKI